MCLTVKRVKVKNHWTKKKYLVHINIIWSSVISQTPILPFFLAFPLRVGQNWFVTANSTKDLSGHKYQGKIHPRGGVGWHDTRTLPCLCKGWCNSTSCKMSQLAECLSLLLGYFL